MLTRERAAEIHKQAMQWPHWGNYTKFMTEPEKEHVNTLFLQAKSGNVSVASIVSAIKNGETIELKPEYTQ